MKCLITGAAGFAGRHLVTELIRRGNRVWGTTADEARREQPLRLPRAAGPLPEAQESPIPCDIRDHHEMAELLASIQPDVIFHLAALTRPGESIQRPRDYLDVNLLGTNALLESVRLARPRARILLISSAHVYASSEARLREDSPLAPKTPYALSKLLAEEMAFNYVRFFGVDAVVVRSFNHTGPGQPQGFVVADLCLRIAGMEAPGGPGPKTLRTRGLDAVRDFLDVRDVVRAYADVVERGRSGEVYNVCSGVPVPIRALVEELGSLSTLGDALRIADDAEAAAGGPDRIVGDNAKLISETGWRPAIPLRQTCAEVLAERRTNP